MDATRFDSLTRSLTAPGSRRRLLGSVVAGALGLAGLRGADARTCTAAGTMCREHANCCSTVCGSKDRTGRRRCAECSSSAQCPLATDVCHVAACLSSGQCGVTVAVPTGFALCTDVCVDTTSDLNNCGGCGTVCPSGQTCGGGTPGVCGPTSTNCTETYGEQCMECTDVLCTSYSTPCSTFGTQCQACTDVECLQCAEGSNLIVNGECVPILCSTFGSACLECAPVGCLQCEIGFVLENGICVSGG